jgi:hypothetical protein
MFLAKQHTSRKVNNVYWNMYNGDIILIPVLNSRNLYSQATKSSCHYRCSLLRASCLPMSSKPTVCAFWNLPRLFRSVARPRTCRSLVSITPAYCVEACIRWPRRTPCPCLLLVSQLHKSTLVLQAIEPVSRFLHIASLLNWQLHKITVKEAVKFSYAHRQWHCPA